MSNFESAFNIVPTQAFQSWSYCFLWRSEKAHKRTHKKAQFWFWKLFWFFKNILKFFLWAFKELFIPSALILLSFFNLSSFFHTTEAFFIKFPSHHDLWFFPISFLLSRFLKKFSSLNCDSRIEKNSQISAESRMSKLWIDEIFLPSQNFGSFKIINSIFLEENDAKIKKNAKVHTKSSKATLKNVTRRAIGKFCFVCLWNLRIYFFYFARGRWGGEMLSKI